MSANASCNKPLNKSVCLFLICLYSCHVDLTTLAFCKVLPNNRISDFKVYTFSSTFACMHIDIRLIAIMYVKDLRDVVDAEDTTF